MVKKSIPQLVKKLDTIFSAYVRLRDATEYIQDEEGLSKRAGYCITCKKLIPAEGKGTGHAGHFIERGCKLTRFEETNVHLQCNYCNTYKAGRQYEYGLAIDKKYGKGAAKALYDLEAQYKREGYKFTRAELDDLTDLYKRKTIEVRNGNKDQGNQTRSWLKC
ncbi:MAG: hypothetical protein NVS1B10_01370 [Candidatus Saccharimonadales bacterium]